MRITVFSLIGLCCALAASAQEQQPVVVSGSIQSDFLVPQRDSAIGAEKPGDILTNTYADVFLQSKHVDGGIRLEYLEHPLPGFENDFKGWGFPSFWVKGKLGKVDLTAGTFYEQFGSGFILRTYEERSLGIDNSLLGVHVEARPLRGLTLKALSGKQRHYWSWKGGLVSGADAEIKVDEWVPGMQAHDAGLTIGGSWVNKYEEDEVILADPTHRYNLPRYVNAWDARTQFDKGAWSVLAEFARKSQDPSFDNQFSYRYGHVAMLSCSYSKQGLTALLQGKRSENMSFRSRRNVTGTSSFINHLPAFTTDHTYALAALYPYATQLASGEWAYQAELGYNFKRKTALGGKHGMNAKLSYSYVRAIDDKWFNWGPETYYHDLNIQLTRRFSQCFKLNLMYMNQHYNKTIVEGDGGMVRSNIFVADGLFQLSSKTRLRCELQYLQTRQDEGDWLFGLLELSLAPHWMFTLSDMWNVGNSDPQFYAANTHIHYYQGFVTYNVGSHRIQAGYARTQAGYSCSGGVCRFIPATKGFILSYNYNF